MSTTTALTRTAPPLSQSKRQLMACAHLYRARVILGVEEAPNEAALRGTEIHEAARDYVEHLIKSRQSSDFDWFVANIFPRPYRAEALQILEEALDSKVFDIDPERVLGTEMYLALNAEMQPLDDSTADHPEECYAYEGTLDRVDIPTSTEAIIHDYKSQFHIVDAEDHYQALHYSLLLLKHYTDIERVTFILHFVRYGSAARDVVYTREDLPEMEKTVRRERERQLTLHAEDIEHKATPGAACTYCPLLNKTCPVNNMNPYSAMSPEDRAAYKIYLTAAAKENDRVLKDFCDLKPIQVRDGNGKLYQIGFKEQEKATYPAADVFPILQEKDAELAKKVTLSGLSSPLKAKKRAALLELVAPHKIVTTQSRFTVSGVEDPEEDSGTE